MKDSLWIKRVVLTLFNLSIFMIESKWENEKKLNKKWKFDDSNAMSIYIEIES